MGRAGFALALALSLAAGLRLLQGLLGARLLEERLGWVVRACALGDPFYDWLAVALLAGAAVALLALPLRRGLWLALVYLAGFALGAWLLVGSLARDCLGNTWLAREILLLTLGQLDLLLACALLAGLPCLLLRRRLNGLRAAPGAADSAG